jgi:hypothetical protein
MVAQLRLLSRLAQATSDANAIYRETVCAEQSSPWDTLDNEEQRKVTMIVAKALEKRFESGEAAHASWLKDHQDDGWSLGESEDREKKQSPYMVEWAELPAAGRAKAELFVAIVRPFYGA